MIDKVIGSAPFAVATVLSVFMGGLALGSWLAGKYIDNINSRRNLLSLYGKVEFAIGIYGLMLPLFIHLVKPVYVLAYNSLFIHFWLYRMFTFFGCSVLLVVPTTLMGVTLPVLCRFYVEDLGHIGVRTGRLYGINTIGGAAGAALCGFFLIANFGMWGTLATAVVINVLIGLLCMGLAQRERPLVSEPIVEEKKENKPKMGAKSKKPRHPEFVPIDDRMVITLALWIFGISGFCSMAYEVFWTRLLGLIIGPTTYSFSLVVSTFIIGLAIGNIIFGRLADRVKGVFRLLIITQVCAAFLALLVSQFLGNSQFFFSKLIYTFQGDFGEKILVQSVVLFFVLVGPTIFLGATFPLVNRIYAKSLPEIGKTVGRAYAANTVGAIFGSFVAGFILIPLMGKENGLRIVLGLQVFVSVMAMSYLIVKSEGRVREFVTGLITLLLALIFLFNFPSWDHNILSRGWYYRFESLQQYFSTTSWLNALKKVPPELAQSVAGSEVVFYGDGIGGFTTVVKSVNPIGTANYYLVNSGKTDATSHADRLTQTLSAHIPLLFHPNPEKVMVLGLASGMTAGEALLYPIKQLDVLEINDQVIKAAEFFNPWNNNCLTNPRTRIIVQDGRNHLELTSEKYDVIISEPSNPWMAGLANLFTFDYFKTVKSRLKKDGIFIQWTNAYDMDWDSFSMVGRTFAEVFPDGLLVKTISSSDFLLVGFSGKKALDLHTAYKNIVYARQSKNITLRDPRVIFDLILTEDLKGFFGKGPLHTDNWPHLEFAAPKNIGGGGNWSIEDKLKNNSWFSKETKEIAESNKNIDSFLDSLELLKAGYSPPFNDIDLKQASPTQIKRFQDIVRDYCSDEYVTDYELFPDPDLRKQCAQFQIDKIRDYLALNGEDSQAQYRLALGLRVIGNVGEEVDVLQKTISLNPSSYDAYVALGQAFTSQGRFDEAVDLLSKAVRLKPDSAEAHDNLGNALINVGKNGEAIEHFSRALQIKPDSAKIYNNFGGALANQGKTDQAIEAFTKALKLEPDYATGYGNLGRLYAGMGRLDEAFTHLSAALKLEPESADFHNDVGLVLAQRGKLSDSILQFSEAIRINPGHLMANYNMGLMLAGQGKINEALSYFFKAIEIDPDYPEARKMLGMVLASQRRFKEAAGQFSEVLRLEPDSAENHDNLGAALAEAGQLQEAIGHFNKALEINNNYEAARNHLAILQEVLNKER
jgi:spermidine synthase